MLRYCVLQGSLELTRGGELLPWLGPALRGLLALRLKERTCRWPPEIRSTRWVHCAGCPHMDGCSYGELFEPDTPSLAPRIRSQGPAARFSGQDDAVRPVILAPHYPVPERVRAGLRIPLRITVLGSAEQHLEELLGALCEVGQPGHFTFHAAPRGSHPLPLPDAPPFSPSAGQAISAAEGDAGTETRRDAAFARGGLGPHHIGFRLCVTARTRGQLAAAELHPTPDALPGVVPRLGVGLVSPLFLRSRDARGKRHPLAVPQFADLFLAATRVLSGLFSLEGQPLTADFKALKAAACQVRLVEHCYEPFHQAKWSSRSAQRFRLQGLAGGAVYADVPWALVPWMLWGGRFHVGPHRVAGAGGWRLLLD